LTLVSALTLQFLEEFLAEAEVSLIITDINKLEFYFPLNDSKNPMNYLNVLMNVFVKYRVYCSDLLELSNHKVLSFGSDFTIKTISDHSSSVEIIEFHTKLDPPQKYLTDPLTKQFFQMMASSSTNPPVVDIITNDSPDFILNHLLLNNSTHIDYGFEQYFHLITIENKKAKVYPKQLSNKILSECIDKCLRYFAYDSVFKVWNYNHFVIYNSQFDLSQISKLKNDYYILEWFFQSSHTSKNFFQTQTANTYMEWIEYCRTGVLNTFDKNISSKLQFNSKFVEKIKRLLDILATKPFCNSVNCIKPEIQTLLDFFITKNPLNNISEIDSHGAILLYYYQLEVLFKTFEMSFESEKFRLQHELLIDAIIRKLVIGSSSTKTGLNFPFKLLWKMSSSSQSDSIYININNDMEKRFINFLHEFINLGVSNNNFHDYRNDIERITVIQEKLLLIGDLPSDSGIEIPEVFELFKNNSSWTIKEIVQFSWLDLQVRKILSNFKHFWYKIVISNPLYKNDPIFNEMFDINIKNEQFGVITQLENYFIKWNEYKSSSKVIKQLEEEIEIVSKLKFNIEGLRLASRKFSGAMSFINGKILMESEKTRLIDAILKDLVSTQLNFQYNDGIRTKLNLTELSTNEKIISSAIEVVEQTQSFKIQILKILQPLPLLNTVEIFADLTKTLLGNNFKTIQITRFSETYNQWITRLKEDSQLLVVGLNIKNFNEYIALFFGIINQATNMIARFYESSLSKEALGKVKILNSTKSIGTFISTLIDINTYLTRLISYLSSKLTHLNIYSEKLAEITEEVYSSYYQIIITEDVLKSLESIKVKYKIEKSLLVIEERITGKESLLEKQLFIEKAFRLALFLNAIFTLIEKKIDTDYKPLIISGSYTNLEEIQNKISLDDQIEVIKSILENIVEYLKSIKILSRSHTQILKIIVYYTPILIERLGIKDDLKTNVFSILQLINSYNHKIKDFGILKSLNQEILLFNDQIYESFVAYLEHYVEKKETIFQIKKLITFYSTEPIYSRNFLLWAKKIQLTLEMLSSNNRLISHTEIGNKLIEINLDKVQEEILDIFVTRKDDEKLVFRKKAKVKRTFTEREKVYQEQISSLKERIRLLEEQISVLQEENKKLKELPLLESPEIIETADIQVETPEQAEEDEVKLRLTELYQEKLPIEEIRVKRNLEKNPFYVTKITHDALIPAKSAEEVNPDLIIKIDPKPIVKEEEELTKLPEFDLIKELRKIGQPNFASYFKPSFGETQTDLINEIESLIETQQALGNATSRQRSTPERTENDELIEEIARRDKKEARSIFSFNLESRIVPETTFRFKSKEELAKFPNSDDKPKQDKSLSSMKSLKEELAEYDDKPTLLELKINAFAKELFGDDVDDENSKETKNNQELPIKKSSKSEFSLVEEMEGLIDPKDKKEKKSK
jgi:hypothetical protein